MLLRTLLLRTLLLRLLLLLLLLEPAVIVLLVCRRLLPTLCLPPPHPPPALPCLGRCRSEEISLQRLNRLRGVANHDRIDAALYQDFESAEARGKRQAKEAKEMERLEKAAAKVCLPASGSGVPVDVGCLWV